MGIKIATAAEIEQARTILFKIRSGIPVRTDPRSTVGGLVQRSLQRQSDLETSLREAQIRELEESRLQSIPEAEREASLQAQQSLLEPTITATPAPTPSLITVKPTEAEEARQVLIGQRTAEEQLLQQSIPAPTTFLGGLKTKEGFEREVFFADIFQQQKEFEQAPELSPFGISTPEGEIAFFIPSVERAKGVSEQAFQELPQVQRRSLIGTEIGIGVTRGLISLATFGPDIVVGLGKSGQLQPGEDIKLFDLPFGTTEQALEKSFKPLREFQEIPTGIPGIVGEVGVIGGTILFGGAGAIKGFKRLKATGFTVREAAVETAGIFSPIRIKPGVFTSPIVEETPSKALSILRKEAGIQRRDIIGVGDEFIFTSRQETIKLPSGKTRAGPVEITIVQEGTLIGGGSLRPGVIISETGGFVRSPRKVGEAFRIFETEDIKVSKRLEEALGGTSESFIQQKFSTFLEGEIPGELTGFVEVSGGKKFRVRRGAGVSRQVGEGLTEFTFGRRQIIPKIETFQDVSILDGGKVEVFRTTIRRPSGRVKVKPTIRGLEIELTKDFSISDVKVPDTFGTIDKTPLSKTFSDRLLGVQKPKAKFSPIEKSLNVQLEAIQSSLVSSKKPTVTSKTLIGLPRFVGREGLAQEQLTFVKQKELQITKQKTRQILRERQIQRQELKLEQILEQKPRAIVDIFGSRARPRFPVGPTPFLFRLPEFKLGGLGGETIGKRIFLRTPSLGAVISFQEFGIKRRRGAGEITGLVGRELGLGALPKIELGSLLGEVTIKRKKGGKNIKKNKTKKRK